MKEHLNEKGLWQAVEDIERSHAIEQVEGPLQLMTINDTYEGRKITSVTFEEDLPNEVKESIGTAQAVLFHLAPTTEYFYVSIEHTGKADPYFCIWQGNHSGYTPNLDFAGVYTEVYGHQVDTLSIPVEILRELSIRITGSGGKKISVVPNCQAVRDELGLKYKGRNLVQKAKGSN